MNKILRDFWIIRNKLEDKRQRYLTAIQRVKLFEDDPCPLTKVNNHYLRRLNQSVCEFAKKEYKEATKEYQEFLRKMEGIRL